MVHHLLGIVSKAAQITVKSKVQAEGPVLTHEVLMAPITVSLAHAFTCLYQLNIEHQRMMTNEYHILQYIMIYSNDSDIWCLKSPTAVAPRLHQPPHRGH